MKTFYHICMTAHSEVLLRNTDDVALMTNFSALAAYRTETDMLTDSQMSTHLHETVLCEDPRRFVWSQELGLTKAFNKRHCRRGPLFDGKPFIQPIQGPKHMQMALNYSLRQGLHHGQSETAFDYPWSTCNQIFTKERGVQCQAPTYISRQEIRDLLHHTADFPDSWVADSNGILLRNCFEQIATVENWYGTARGYMYSMMRRTSREWLEEQGKDDVENPPVTLQMIERSYSMEDVDSMLGFEGNSKYTNRQMSDMEVCTLIDTQLLGRYHVDSVYSLSQRQKVAIANELRYDLQITNEAQLARCLVMNYDNGR